MDRDAEWVEFSHDAMAGPGPVRVRQNLDAVDGIARGDDATARWVWPGATATARWLCDRKTEWIEGKHVVEIGSGTGLLGECTVSPVDPNSVASLLRVKVRHPEQYLTFVVITRPVIRSGRRAPGGRLRDPHGPPLGAPVAPRERGD